MDPLNCNGLYHFLGPVGCSYTEKWNVSVRVDPLSSHNETHRLVEGHYNKIMLQTFFQLYSSLPLAIFSQTNEMTCIYEVPTENQVGKKISSWMTCIIVVDSFAFAVVRLL